MNCAPIWTIILSALLVPTVAIIASFIAYQQWRTAQNKLKHDLFDRRFSVYESSRNFLASVMTSGKIKDDELFKFLLGTREAKWLLNEKVAEYLEKDLYRKALDLQCIDAELEAAPVGEDRTSSVQKRSEIWKWIIHQYPVLDETFSPYLKLGH